MTTSYSSSRRLIVFSAAGSCSVVKSKGRRSPALSAHHEAEPCESTSTISTREASAQIAARLIAVVVLPTPPFCASTATTCMFPPKSVGPELCYSGGPGARLSVDPVVRHSASTDLCYSRSLRLTDSIRRPWPAGDATPLVCQFHP